jgi:phage-related protein
MERPLIWLGTSLDDLKEFPVEAKKEAGHQLNSVQNGFDPTDWKPFGLIGPGVREIRIKDSHGIFRIMYVAKFVEGVYVLHSFQKKAQKTAKQDIELAKARYNSIVAEQVNK